MDGMSLTKMRLESPRLIPATRHLEPEDSKKIDFDVAIFTSCFHEERLILQKHF